MTLRRFHRPECAIVDVDGSLVDVSGIRHHVLPMTDDGEYKQRNFDAFHRDAIDCPPIPDTVELVHKLHEIGLKILIVTARSQKYGRQTAFWLAMHGIPSDALIMRREGDMRKDVLVKHDILHSNILPAWHPVHAVDDNPSIIDLWSDHRIDVSVVPGWEA